MDAPQPSAPKGFAGLAALGVDVGAVLGPPDAPPPQPEATTTATATAPPRPGAKPYQGKQSALGGRKRFTRGAIIGGVFLALIVGAAVIGVVTEGGTSETMPSVGRGNTLSRAEIRYCLAEEIRLQGAQSALSRDAKRNDIPRFNQMVDDYNSRCASYRYRSGTLESARRDIEPARDQLRAAGAARFAP
jgi:hypothetical protein